MLEFTELTSGGEQDFRPNVRTAEWDHKTSVVINASRFLFPCWISRKGRKTLQDDVGLKNRKDFLFFFRSQRCCKPRLLFSHIDPVATTHQVHTHCESVMPSFLTAVCCDVCGFVHTQVYFNKTAFLNANCCLECTFLFRMQKLLRMQAAA